MGSSCLLSKFSSLNSTSRFFRQADHRSLTSFFCFAKKAIGPSKNQLLRLRSDVEPFFYILDFIFSLFYAMIYEISLDGRVVIGVVPLVLLKIQLRVCPANIYCVSLKAFYRPYMCSANKVNACSPSSGKKVNSYVAATSSTQMRQPLQEISWRKRPPNRGTCASCCKNSLTS